MHLTKMHIMNFKSLLDFRMDLAKFSCMIGLNGSGKTTVLQAIDFISQQMKGNIDDWLAMRGWEAVDLKSKLANVSNISGDLCFDTEFGEVRWAFRFNRQSNRCTDEKIVFVDSLMMVNVKDGHYSVSSDLNKPPDIIRKTLITFDYQGSILSQIKEELLPESLVAFKHFVASITSLDALSPQHLRKRARSSEGGIGLAGEQLSAFLSQMPNDEVAAILERLKAHYPHLSDIDLTSMRSGWKALSIKEKYAGHTIKTSAQHVNDGMLRLLAIFAEAASGHDFVLFDEVENGINPELIEFMLDYLVSIDKQVMVTTHSPMILNYLEDDVAKAGVQYIYKLDDGQTKAIPFFNIPSLANKLRVMGPGEAFVDTQLGQLIKEIQEIPKETS